MLAAQACVIAAARLTALVAELGITIITVDDALGTGEVSTIAALRAAVVAVEFGVARLAHGLARATQQDFTHLTLLLVKSGDACPVTLATPDKILAHHVHAVYVGHQVRQHCNHRLAFHLLQVGVQSRKI